MALFTTDNGPIPTPLPPPVQPRIETPTFEGITVDTSYTPSSTLLQWIEGSNWTVEYYSQVLAADVEPTPLALEREPIYQQYRRIKKMQLKVTSPISFSQDPLTTTMEVRGSGIVYPFLTPNRGDMFIADAGDGRLGLFTIVLPPQRATILKDSTYTIEYQMVSWLTPEQKANLEAKTVETLIFSQTNLACGCSPFISEQEEAREGRYRKLFQDLLQRYISDFFSFDHSTLLVPDQLRKTYDPFLVTAFLQLVDSNQDHRLRRIRALNTNAEQRFRQPTLWDAVLRSDGSRLHGAIWRAALANTRNLRGMPWLQAIGYSGIERIVYPLEHSPTVDDHYQGRADQLPATHPYREGRPRRYSGEPHSQAERNLPWFAANPDPQAPLWQRPADLKPVVVDDYYVLSEAFYLKQDGQLSKLERLLWQLLEREALDLAALDALLTHVYDWDNLERFYYYPLVMALLKRLGAG